LQARVEEIRNLIKTDSEFIARFAHLDSMLHDHVGKPIFVAFQCAVENMIEFDVGNLHGTNSDRSALEIGAPFHDPSYQEIYLCATTLNDAGVCI
jgi:hypothetical protein